MARRRTKQRPITVVPAQEPRFRLLGDPDRRRALLLSILVHAGLLLTIIALSLRTPPEEPERLVLLELTPPQAGATQTEGAAADERVQPAAASQVAGNAANDVVESPPAAQTPPPSQPPAAVAETPVAPPVRPLGEQAPQAQVPRRQPPQALPLQAPSSTLPEVEAPEVAPQPLEQALALPTPEAEAEITPAQRIDVTPQVELTETQPLERPEATATIVTEPIVTPEAQVEVAPAAPVPQPQASASVATRDVPSPPATVSVTPLAPVPQPSASSSVTAAAPLPSPQAAATVTPGQSLAITPTVQVGEAVPLTTPSAGVTVTLPEPPAQAEAGGGEGGGAAAAADAGDAPQSGQAEARAPAATGQGAASDASGVAASGVANVQSFEVSVDAPLAVLLDNADAAYPQQGLVEASSVYEMPVEGGMTRLMSVYTEGDPAQVGPIRSARDYFLEAALQLNGTLVHVGGAPSTVSRIASQNLETLDALQQGPLFAQAPDRFAPHNTFSTGTALREAVGQLESQVSGTLYVPPSTAPDASSVSVAYSGSYSSGFSYLSDIDQYRWLRNGAAATDTVGTAVTADSVVVAQVTAFPYPDDPEGRLYLPYSGGSATLYLRGKAVTGSWTPENGFSFVTDTGVPVDLRPFKHWILFAPETAQVTVG